MITRLLLAWLSVAMASGCGPTDDEISAVRYFPLTVGSWWEYQTPDGPIRVEVVGEKQREGARWAIVTTSLLDGHRRLAATGSYVVDTIYYGVRDGAVYVAGDGPFEPRLDLPLGGAEAPDVWIEEADTDTVPAGIFAQCLLVHDDRDGEGRRIASLAPGVGLIAEEGDTLAGGRRLRAWHIAAPSGR